jgi:quinol monooxygenase YgiN
VDQANEPLFLIAVIRPRLDRMEEAERELRALMAGTVAEPGNIYMELVVGDQPDTWIMLEKFRSRPDWDDHMRTEHVIKGNAALADLLREPTELTFYTLKP